MNTNDSLPEQRHISRKKFVQLAGLCTVGAALDPLELFATKGNAAAPLGKIALQLYTVRNQVKENIGDTLKKIAATGIKNVETAFWPESISVKQAAKYLKDAGLNVCSAHVELPVGEKKQAMLEIAEAYNCKKMIWHGWPEDKRYSSEEGTKQLAETYNQASDFARSNGLQFGLHNHWWEYRNKVNGRNPYEILLELTDPDIFFEIDTYWVKVADHDPAQIVKKFGKRASLLHIKDGPAKWHESLTSDNPDPMVAAGKGTQNFPAIVKAANGNTEWMVIEMDVTKGDVFEAIGESYDYLVTNKLAIAG